MISSNVAIEKMRRYTKAGMHFKIQHLTYNQVNNECNGLRTVSNCSLRPGLKANLFSTDADHYLTYYDHDADMPRQAFKKLIRWVAFAPDYNYIKINWFI